MWTAWLTILSFLFKHFSQACLLDPTAMNFISSILGHLKTLEVISCIVIDYEYKVFMPSIELMLIIVIHENIVHVCYI